MRYETLFRKQLEILLPRFRQGHGWTEKYAGVRVCNDPGFYAKIKTSRFGVRFFDNVMQSLSDQWPAGCEWPADIPRPIPRPIPSSPSAIPATEEKEEA